MNKNPLKENKPEIEKLDEEFAREIAIEFNIRQDEVMLFIQEVRHYVLYDCFTERERLSMEQMQASEDPVCLLRKEISIQEIIIKTDLGSINIKPSDFYFQYLKPGIRKLKVAVTKALDHDDKADKNLKRHHLLETILGFFYQGKSLNKSNAFYATGLCMVHFKLYGYKPILEKKDFTDDYAAYDYKHYLIDIVKRRLIYSIEYYESGLYNDFMDDPSFIQLLKDSEKENGLFYG